MSDQAARPARVTLDANTTFAQVRGGETYADWAAARRAGATQRQYWHLVVAEPGGASDTRAAEIEWNLAAARALLGRARTVCGRLPEDEDQGADTPRGEWHHAGFYKLGSDEPEEDAWNTICPACLPRAEDSVL